jgi:hypothetical protein
VTAWAERVITGVLDVVEGAQRLDRMTASFGEVASFEVHCELPSGWTLVEAIDAADPTEPGFLTSGSDPGGLSPTGRMHARRATRIEHARAYWRRYYRQVRKPRKEAAAP